MSAAIEHTNLRTGGETSPLLTVRDLLLLRIAVGSATRADLQRDLAPVLASKMSSLEFRRSAELAISTLVGGNFSTETKGRLTITEKGGQVAEASFAASRLFPASWADAKPA